ncbi:MAG: hypothetical protein WB987_17335 [Candidatus Acidiferrales bacterium]
MHKAEKLFEWASMWHFIRSVARHWGILVTSGVLIGLVGVWQGTNHRVAPAVYWCIALIALFIAFYRAWLDERRAGVVSKSGPSACIKADAEFIDITNEGAGAHFYVPIQIDGMVNGQKSGIFARWEHTNSARSWIAKGQTCRLQLARMERKALCNQWVILAVLSDDSVLDIPATYSSCAVSEPITKAPDIVVTGQVVAEPDLENGVQWFGVTLRAFDAISVIQK